MKELETTATGNAEYGYRKLKKREYAAYHHANGTAKAMRWCAKKLREIQIAANEKLKHGDGKQSPTANETTK